MDKPGTTWSNIIGSNKNKLDEMKKRLADVQEAHKIAKVNGLFTVAVTTAGDVVDIKTDAHRVYQRLEDLTATVQAQSTKKEKKDELDELRVLCKEIYPHSIEVATLVNRCAKGTRKWIVDQALESIENGEEKITWLRYFDPEVASANEHRTPLDTESVREPPRPMFQSLG
ncbi:hypothetical protein BJ741DRAFT_120984 [Chytriomyces cf. hyalinus JEL632]|nr:hypothetical protein BJ741DRAFT_120984 [Chytriomyces cf. hyalinus JEL632]